MADHSEAQFPPPRDFQAKAHELLRDGVRKGHRCQMLMAPTGAGKTYLGLRICYEAVQRGKTAVFLCDRTTLINQTSATADAYGFKNHAIIQANHSRRDISQPFQIASAQTIAKRGYWPHADVIVIDEAHTTYKVWTEFVPQTKATVIGLSATPFSVGLANLFSNLVVAATMDELTQLGVLVPMRVLSCTRPDMTGAKTSGGEWTDRAAEERGMAIIGDVVTEWIRHGQGRKTIVFGSTIRHCQELAKQFMNCGVMAAVFTAETTHAEREVLLNEYRKPDSSLRVLISVEALAKGFDVPDVGCVVDCRPLRKSLSTAIQMWGRGLRSCEGKKDCILLDHSGNIVRFAKDFGDIYFDGLDSMNAGEKLDKEVRKDDDLFEKKSCPKCGHSPFHRICMACGYEKQPPALVAHESGAMAEVEVFSRAGKTKLADSHKHLWEQLSSYARIYSEPGRQQGRARHLFRDIAGMDAPSDWLVAETKTVPITTAVRGQITRLNMRWKMGKGARYGVR